MGAARRLDQRQDGSLLGELVAVLGEERTSELVAAFGGKQIYVPRAPGAAHPVTAAIGAVAAERLAEFWHGMTITVPATPARRALVLKLAAEGVRPNSIVSRVHCSRSYVYKVLDEARRAADDTPDLFRAA